jgi:RimJ/RimL family protein N-acetyltransferase
VIAAGPNVRIRHRVASDGENEYRWRSDPESARYNGVAPNKGLLREFLDAFVYELRTGRSDREQFAIDTIDGTHVGSVMLYNFSRGGEGAELGITLGEEAIRGRGLGREAVILILRWAWNNRAIRGVYLHTLEWNERAIRCFRAAGFGEVARVLRDDQALVRMEVRREWWLLWEMEGRFALAPAQGAQSAAGDEGSPRPASGESALVG